MGGGTLTAVAATPTRQEGEARWLSRTAVPPNRPNNLYGPLPGHYGAYGQFNEGAITFSLQSWANRYRGWLGLAALGFTAWAWAEREKAQRMDSRQDLR